MLHVPFHTQIQTYVTIKIVIDTFSILHRVLDLQGRVYAENMYRIRKIDENKFVWLNEKDSVDGYGGVVRYGEVELSPVMPSFATLVNYMARHLQRDPNVTPRAFEQPYQ